MTERDTTINREVFQSAYSTRAPWDTGKPQPAFEAAAGGIQGSILDVGCGTGENALFFAARGHAVTGIDFLQEAVGLANKKATERHLAATFLVRDALSLQGWSQQFDNVIDSGLFHVFSDQDRIRYAQGLHNVLKPQGRLFLLCFSDEVPGTLGPRRVSQKELRDSFSQGWEVESIESTRFDIHPESRMAVPSGEGPKAWFMIAQRRA